MKTTLTALSLILLGLLAGRANADEPLTFEQHVRPDPQGVLPRLPRRRREAAGRLDLRLKRFAVEGRRERPGRRPGRAGARACSSQRMKSGEMPPGEKKVPAEQIAVIEKWIAAGAPTPARRAGDAAAGPRHHAGGAGVLVLPAAPAAGRRRRSAGRPRPHADRRLRAGEAAREGAVASTRTPTG